MMAQDENGRTAGPRSLLRPAVVGLALTVAVTISGVLPVTAGPPGGPSVAQAATPPPASTDVTFEVVPTQPPAPPTPQPSPSGGHLPVTGNDPEPGWLLALGTLLVLAGTVITAFARRRDRRHS